MGYTFSLQNFQDKQNCLVHTTNKCREVAAVFFFPQFPWEHPEIKVYLLKTPPVLNYSTEKLRTISALQPAMLCIQMHSPQSNPQPLQPAVLRAAAILLLSKAIASSVSRRKPWVWQGTGTAEDSQPTHRK